MWFRAIARELALIIMSYIQPVATSVTISKDEVARGIPSKASVELSVPHTDSGFQHGKGTCSRSYILFIVEPSVAEQLIWPPDHTWVPYEALDLHHLMEANKQPYKAGTHNSSNF